MNLLSLFGLFAVTAMMICYAFEDRSSWFVLAFAGACALGSIYGFLQGAWPFGLAESIWRLIAIWRWEELILRTIWVGTVALGGIDARGFGCSSIPLARLPR